MPLHARPSSCCRCLLSTKGFPAPLPVSLQRFSFISDQQTKLLILLVPPPPLSCLFHPIWGDLHAFLIDSIRHLIPLTLGDVKDEHVIFALQATNRNPSGT